MVWTLAILGILFGWLAADLSYRHSHRAEASTGWRYFW